MNLFYKLLFLSIFFVNNHFAADGKAIVELTSIIKDADMLSEINVLIDFIIWRQNTEKEKSFYIYPTDGVRFNGKDFVNRSLFIKFDIIQNIFLKSITDNDIQCLESIALNFPNIHKVFFKVNLKYGPFNNYAYKEWMDEIELITGVKYNDVNLVRWLLQYGKQNLEKCDLYSNGEYDSYCSPLLTASLDHLKYNNRTQLILLLLNHGADINPEFCVKDNSLPLVPSEQLSFLILCKRHRQIRAVYETFLAQRKSALYLNLDMPQELKDLIFEYDSQVII